MDICSSLNGKLRSWYRWSSPRIAAVYRDGSNCCNVSSPTPMAAAAAASGYRCIWRTCAVAQRREERDGDLGHSARNVFQRRHAAEASRDIYRCLLEACERNVGVHLGMKNYRHFFFLAESPSARLA